MCFLSNWEGLDWLMLCITHYSWMRNKSRKENFPLHQDEHWKYEITWIFSVKAFLFPLIGHNVSVWKSIFCSQKNTEQTCTQWHFWLEIHRYYQVLQFYRNFSGFHIYKVKYMNIKSWQSRGLCISILTTSGSVFIYPRSSLLITLLKKSCSPSREYNGGKWLALGIKGYNSPQ